MAQFVNIMTNSGLVFILDRICGYLSYDAMENFCEAFPEFCDESLERLILLKFLYELGDRNIKNFDGQVKKVKEVIGYWNKDFKKAESKASLADLQEIKAELTGRAFRYACRPGNTELVQFMIRSSKKHGFDLKKIDHYVGTAFRFACRSGSTKVVELIIRSSKDHGIDLNKLDHNGTTAFQYACGWGRLEVAKVILQNHRFGIDIKHQDNHGKTALDYVQERLRKRRNRYDECRLRDLERMLSSEIRKLA